MDGIVWFIKFSQLQSFKYKSLEAGSASFNLFRNEKNGWSSYEELQNLIP